MTSDEHAPPDRPAGPHRPRPPEGRRPGAVAAVLLRRPRLRAHPAVRHAGGVRLGGRLPPPHRAEHLGEPGRVAAACRGPRACTTSPSSTRPGRRWPTPSGVLIAAGIPLDGASDHGVSEALYLRDPDDNGVELYWDRPQDAWPRTPEGELAMFTRRLDLDGLLEESRGGAGRPGGRRGAAGLRGHPRTSSTFLVSWHGPRRSLSRRVESMPQQEVHQCQCPDCLGPEPHPDQETPPADEPPAQPPR